MGRRFAQRGSPLRLLWALDAVWRLSYRPGLQASSAQALRDVVERIRLDPAMHEVRELEALQRCCSGEVQLPVELEADVRRLALGRDPAVRLQAEDTSPAALRSAAQAGVARWRSFRMHAQPAQDEVARVMLRSYQIAAAPSSAAPGSDR